MQGNIPYMFDCWADTVVHFLLGMTQHWATWVSFRNATFTNKD